MPAAAGSTSIATAELPMRPLVRHRHIAALVCAYHRHQRQVARRPMNPPNKLALHTWTVENTPLDVALDATKSAGFDAVEIRRSDIVHCYERGQSFDGVARMICASGLPVGILGTEYGWLFASGAEQRRLFGVLHETCRLARAVGCEMIMTAPGQLVGTVAQAAAATRIAGEIVGEYGLRLALEFNSQHDVINRTAVLREIIDTAGSGPCGLLLDSYHMFRGEGIARSLAGVRADELFVVQYSDVPPVPAAGVRRPIDRLAPGDGQVDWPELFELLKAIGYRGYLSYEAPNPVFWERSPYEVAAEGARKTRALLNQHVRSTA